MNYDVIVIGSGQAGVPLAKHLGEAGRKVLVAERGALGGTCVNVGCTPTKTLIASARAAHAARTAGRLGIRVPSVEVDFQAVMDRKQSIVDRWRGGVESSLGKAQGVTLVRGHARLSGPGEVQVDGAKHHAPVIVLNVGARPVTPKLPGLEEVPWVTSSGLLELRELPKHLLVLGGGYIGCELGQAFGRLGARVTLIDPHDHLLSREDPEVSAALESVFRKESIELRLGRRVTRVRRAQAGLSVSLDDGNELEGSLLLVAAGREPNTQDLGCERVGVRLDERGYIPVDEQYQTNVAGLYALGDCTPQPQFTHTSWDDHRVLLDVLMGKAARPRSRRTIPFTVFTDPQVAGAGLTEREAQRQGVPYQLAQMDFGNIARAAEVDETAGVMRLLVHPQTERILGVTLVGAEAGELLHVFLALMLADASVRHLVEGQFVHPTYAEGLQSLVMQLPLFSES